MLSLGWQTLVLTFGDVMVSTGEVVAEEAGRVGASPLKRRKNIIANDNYAFAA